MQQIQLLLRICVQYFSLVLLFEFADSFLIPYDDQNTPRHVHLSYSELANQMTVTWSTIVMPPNNSRPLVQYGTVDSNWSSVYATSKLFIDGGHAKASQYIHSAVLTNLASNQTYAYRCGSDSPDALWTMVFSFTSMRQDTDWSPTFAVFGDMGAVNAQSLPRLLQDANDRVFDAVLHVGDFAYDLSTNDGTMGDRFMTMIEPLASNIPYMTTVGNHEFHYNFSNYKARFSMPTGNADKLFYSFNMGPVHFVSVSSEFYFYLEFGFTQIFTQFAWLEEDLKEANKAENRSLRPWIIFLCHRPIYCSNKDWDCTLGAVWLRYGIPGIHLIGLEPLLAKYGVDMGIWAHEHSYERLWPIYDNNIYNGSLLAPYTDPGAPVHIITGSAGCREKHDSFGPVQDMTAFRSNDYGYSRMRVVNASHLIWQQVSDDQGGKIIDTMTLIKHSHGPYNHLFMKSEQ